MSISTLLRRVQLFADLNSSEIEQLAAICTPIEAGHGDTIIQQNTTGTEMYIVATGEVEVYIQGLNNARSLVLLGEGQVVGEMALIDQGYRSASVRATKRGAVLYKIERDVFYDLCNTNTHIGFLVMRNLAVDIAFKLRHRNLAEL